MSCNSLVGIVLTRDQQRREFEPGIRFVPDVLEGFEHRREMAAANLVIKAIGERLEIHVGRIHRGEKLDARLGVDITGRDRDRLHAGFAAGRRDVDRVFEKYDRVVIRETRHSGTKVPSPPRPGAPGIARSASVSISRDLLISQFWQNLQARLQPAVPNDSTALPG